jgi:hypothetical protein
MFRLFRLTSARALAISLFPSVVHAQLLGQCVPVPTCLGDFDDDGIRGTADLLILLSYFGFTCE